MRYEPAAALAPGTVCRDAIVGWINSPLFVVRPRNGEVEGRTVRAANTAYPLAFTEGEDEVLADAKKRPVLLVASAQEIRGRARYLRVVPIHSRGDKRFFRENWDDIKSGFVAGLIAMPDGRPDFEFDEGVLDLTAGQRIDRAFLPNAPWFKLDRSSLVGVVAAMERLLRLALLPGGN